MAGEIVLLAPRGTAQHAHALAARLGPRARIEAEWLTDAALRPETEVLVVFDEHGAELSHLVAEARRRRIATLQVMDGILEWRRTWAYPTSEEKRPLNQPALADKIACLGAADRRILEFWGNRGRCEVVGVPRFDSLTAARRTCRSTPVEGRPLRVLVMTAKTPGFSPEQVEAAMASLRDLRATADRVGVELVWRLTADLADRLGVPNTTRDVLSNELHASLSAVDAVVTTPSTAMLEAMLAGLPTALIDYTNSPSYLPAAWRITAEPHIAPVLADLAAPPPARVQYQEMCLEDALDVRPDATGRMVGLIEALAAGRAAQGGGSGPLGFPPDLLSPAPQPAEHVLGRLEARYPDHAAYRLRQQAELQAELEAARGTCALLERRLIASERRWERIPGYTLLRRLIRSRRGRRP